MYCRLWGLGLGRTLGAQGCEVLDSSGSGFLCLGVAGTSLWVSGL